MSNEFLYNVFATNGIFHVGFLGRLGGADRGGEIEHLFPKILPLDSSQHENYFHHRKQILYFFFVPHAPVVRIFLYASVWRMFVENFSEKSSALLCGAVRGVLILSWWLDTKRFF